jgi:hypothetical protein
MDLEDVGQCGDIMRYCGISWDIDGYLIFARMVTGCHLDWLHVTRMPAESRGEVSSPIPVPTCSNPYCRAVPPICTSPASHEPAGKLDTLDC